MPHSPKRILYVASEATFFVSHWLPFALAASRRGYDVHVATPGGKNADVIVKTGLPWHEIVMRRRVSLWREAAAVPELVLLYRRLRPDLIHHIAVKGVLYGTIASRITGIPAIFNSFAGLGIAFNGQRSKSLLGRALSRAFSMTLRHPHMRVMFENNDNRDLLVQRGWLRREDTVIIPGAGVDINDYRPADVPPQGPPLVVMAARLLKSKGVLQFVEAARRVRASGVEGRFAVVGEPDPDNPDTITAAQLDEWRREGAVEVWGRRNDMPDVLRQASVYALPTFYLEGIPKALMEAGATGIPSVTTDTPGCRDIIVHGRTGLIVPPRDVDALASAFRTLLQDASLRERLGRQARERVVAEFSVERTSAAVLANYQDLIGTP